MESAGHRLHCGWPIQTRSAHNFPGPGRSCRRSYSHRVLGTCLNTFHSGVIPSGARDLTVVASKRLRTLCDQSSNERSFTSFRMTTRHFIIATAGHVDHGKSALVKALTGTDPDRLPEEKRRQITIDL